MVLVRLLLVLGLAAIGVTQSEGFSASRIALSFSPRSDKVPLCAQIDGEEFPSCASATIEVLPRALRLIVPAEHARKCATG